MKIPQGGLIGKGVSLVRRVQKMNISNHAANAGYFIILAIFPLLVVLLGILHYTGLDAADLLGFLAMYLPDALESAVEKLLVQAYAHTGAASISVSAVIALWSASRGMYGILRGMNAIYDAQEDRGWLYTRGISVLYTFVFVVVLVLSLVLDVFGESILDMLVIPGFLWNILSGVVDFHILFMLLVQTAVFTAMYMMLPNRHNRFRSSLPGAVFASLGWQIFSALFSLYVDNWAGYSAIYGSVYAVALGMLWLYFCLSILFYGGAANFLLMRRQKGK